MPSANTDLVKINIFEDTDAFLAHTETEPGANELTLVGDVAVVIESYVNGSSWYRKWSDGWIEQGGSIYVSASGQALNFLMAFSDTNYTIVSGGTEAQRGNTSCYDKTPTGCKLWTSDDSSFNAGGIEWEAKGY
jgi:hypothetical protein